MPRINSLPRNTFAIVPRFTRYVALLVLLALYCAALPMTGTQAQDSAPANDNFADAIDLGSSATGGVSNSNVGGTLEDGEPDPENYTPGGASIWYKWTAPANGNYSFNTFNNETTDPNNTPDDPYDDENTHVTDTVLGVFVGTAINDLTEVASDDDGAEDPFPGFQSVVRFSATAGTVYYISTDSYSGQDNAGRIALNWRQLTSPPHDNFADAIDLGTETQGTASGGYNEDASTEAGEPAHDGDGPYRSIWFKWTAPADGYMRFDSNDSDFDENIGVYVGSSVDALTPVADNGDMSDSVEFFTAAGTVYHIAIDGDDDDDFGNIVLNWLATTPPVAPANDNFADGEDIAGASGSVTRSTDNATRETGEPNHTFKGDPDNDFNDVHPNTIWFDYTPTESGTVAFDTLQTPCEFGGDCIATQLAVYTGDSVNALTEVASNDNADPDFNNGQFTSGSFVYFNGVAGTTYRVVLAAKVERADYVLTWQPFTIPVPANDDFANRQILTGVTPPTSDVTQGVQGTTKFASLEAGEPVHAQTPGGASVWYEWTSPESGGVFFNVFGRNFNPTVGIYTGTNLNALTEIASTSTNQPGFSATAKVAFQATTGTTYLIAVDGRSNVNFGNTSGKITLTFNYDRTAPTTNAQVSGTQQNGFFRATPSIFLSTSDGTPSSPQSGIRSLTYRANGAQTIPATTSSSTFAQPRVTAEGTTVIYYFATDNAGNVETEKSLTIRIDKTAPTITLAAAPTAWSKTDVTINGTASDANSALANAADANFTLTTAVPSGTQTANATTNSRQICDKAGNCATAGSVTGIKVDKTLPTTSFSVQRNGNAFIVTVAVADTGSGIGSTVYSINNCTPVTYNGPFTNGSYSFALPGTCLRSGSNTVTYYGKDIAGNQETAKTVVFTVPPAPLTPILECVRQNSNNTFTATFGYQNDNSFVVTVPLSANNKFTTTPASGAPVTTFQPGRVRNAFTVTYSGNNLGWYLRGLDNTARTATATRNSTRCP